jgi:phosphomevalonate kinase
MAEKNSNLNDSLNKRDLEIILEVNKKAIEIETEVAEQNESIISSLEKLTEQQSDIKEKVEKLMTFGQTEKIPLILAVIYLF